jgi:hypothetical protein
MKAGTWRPLTPEPPGRCASSCQSGTVHVLSGSNTTARSTASPTAQAKGGCTSRQAMTMCAAGVRQLVAHSLPEERHIIQHQLHMAAHHTKPLAALAPVRRGDAVALKQVKGG